MSGVVSDYWQLTQLGFAMREIFEFVLRLNLKREMYIGIVDNKK